MCDSCWDEDKKLAFLKNNIACNGEMKPFMTIEQLKSEIVQEWLTTDKTEYRVYKQSVIDPPGESYSWEAIKALNQPKARLKVQFI